MEGGREGERAICRRLRHVLVSGKREKVRDRETARARARERERLASSRQFCPQMRTSPIFTASFACFHLRRLLLAIGVEVLCSFNLDHSVPKCEHPLLCGLLGHLQVKASKAR